jgi:hypothetical protein
MATEKKASKLQTASMETVLWESHKVVKRCVMNRGEYNKYRGWKLPKDEDGADEGYLVEYTDGGEPNHPWHPGYISWSPKPQFDGGYTKEGAKKPLSNSDVDGAKKNVGDLEVFGNGDMFVLLCKASSKAEGWMKSTKAMVIPGVGCVVQVTTQQGEQVSEAVTFVPGVKITGTKGNRTLVRF